MYKNQLQELAQRSCFNLPSYTCIREGPDHAPRFRASVNFNGEIFEGPSYCTTLRQAEHAAAEVALNTLSTRVPPKSLAAKVLDETGVYKNLLQETAHRAGLNLPVYTTVRSGPGHLPVFTCSVELAGMSFNGEPARTKKQAEKNAAMAAWSALKQMPNLNSLSQTNKEFSDISEEQEPVIVARALSALRPKDESTKQVRQREHQQNVLRKKMMMSYRDRNPNHSISSRCHQWRWQDLMSDVSLYSTQRQTQLHNRAHQQSLLLPLSAPPPGPKLLPSMNIYRQQQNQVELPSQSSSSVFSREASPSIGNQTRQSIAVQIKTKPLIKTQEIATPLGDHLKDEEEWLTGSKKPANARSFRANQPPLGSRILPPRMFCAMDFPTHSMAPAVQIRSVIPVCAAPPIRPPTPVQDQIQNQEASASNSKQEISSDTVAIAMANLSL